MVETETDGDAFAHAAATSARDYRLKVDKLLSEMDTADADKIRAVLFDPLVSADRCSAGFQTIGVSVSPGAIKNWRQRHAAG